MPGSTLFVDNSKWFKNVSSAEIPTDISDFLSLGPKFGVPVVGKDLNIGRFIADVEGIIAEVPDEAANVMRARVTNVVTNFLSVSPNQKTNSYNSCFHKTKKFLKEHPNLLIIQADKGGCTVAMDKTDYMEKTMTLLQDPLTYKLLNSDPTETVQRKYNTLLRKIASTKQLSDQQLKDLTIYNSTFPKLYCLPKIHKPNIPLRPIVSSINSTTYNLSKFLSRILTDSLAEVTDYNIQDTFTLVNKINGFTLPTNYILISLDVISLFTNIPLQLLLDIIEQKWDLVKSHTTLSLHSMLELIKFTFNNCYFAFDKKFYLQTFGTPMGSPISPVLALIVMDFLLDSVIPQLPFQLPFLFKYVDDIVCAIPHDQADTILHYFNSFNPHLQFTIEIEQQRGIPFLDAKLIRTENNTIITDWYQKPTASGRYLNYFSNHPKNHKFNTVIAMKNRVTHISDERFLHENLRKLFGIFANNGYPKSILNKLIYNSNFFDGPTERNNTVLKYKKLPFIENLTNKIVTFFKPFNELSIAKYNTMTIRNLFTVVKETTPLNYKNHTVYKVPCLGCQSCYIGQTSQWLKHRLSQHRSDCRLGKRSCALANHTAEKDHNFDFDNVKILDSDTNYKKRLFLEMFHIHKNSTVNFKSDTNQLSNIYCNILQRYNS